MTRQVIVAAAITISINIFSQQPVNDPNSACRALKPQPVSLPPLRTHCPAAALASPGPTEMLRNIPTPRLSPCCFLHLQCPSRQWVAPSLHSDFGSETFPTQSKYTLNQPQVIFSLLNLLYIFYHTYHYLTLLYADLFIYCLPYLLECKFPEGRFLSISFCIMSQYLEDAA